VKAGRERIILQERLGERPARRILGPFHPATSNPKVLRNQRRRTRWKPSAWPASSNWEPRRGPKICTRAAPRTRKASQAPPCRAKSNWSGRHSDGNVGGGEPR